MSAEKAGGYEVAKGAGRLVSHLAAVVVGLALMVVGIGLGVTLVLLPVAIPVGLGGLFVFLWGLFGRAEGAGQGP
jgi:hypothetical protein